MTGGSEGATTCSVCWALVPRTMMTFHRDWHDGLDRAVDAERTDVPGLVAVEPRRTAC